MKLHVFQIILKKRKSEFLILFLLSRERSVLDHEPLVGGLLIRANFAILSAKEKVTEGARRMTELDKKLAKAAPKAL